MVTDIDNVKIYEHKLIILPNSSLKHTRTKAIAIVYEQAISISISISQIQWEPILCVAECAQLYIEIRKELVPPEIKQFLVTYGKPHKAASDDTISQWIKNFISYMNRSRQQQGWI